MSARSVFDPLFIAWTYLVFVVSVSVWLPVMVILAIVTFPFDRGRRVVGRFLRWCAIVVARTCPLWTIRVEGRWPAGPRRAYVLVSNHESNVDPFILSHLPREVKWMAKDSLFRIPWIGWMLRLSGDIPVVRGDRESGGSALDKARHYLQIGVPVMVFPEGTRSRDGNLLPFKTGAFRLAIATRCPILPCVVAGTAGALEPGSLRLRRAKLRVRVLDPVEVSGLTADDVDSLRDRVRALIQKERARLAAES